MFCTELKGFTEYWLEIHQGVESVVMLPRGTNCPGCDNKEKEYFITAGNKGTVMLKCSLLCSHLGQSHATLPVPMSLLHTNIYSCPIVGHYFTWTNQCLVIIFSAPITAWPAILVFYFFPWKTLTGHWLVHIFGVNLCEEMKAEL